MKMPRELKEKWIEALRSGKYKQGYGVLKTKGEYCCLGVLQELRGVEEKIVGDGVSTFNGFSTVLDEKTCRDLNCLNIGFDIPQECIKECTPYWAEDRHVSIANVNDLGVPFSKIADLVEKYVEVCDEPATK